MLSRRWAAAQRTPTRTWTAFSLARSTSDVGRRYELNRRAAAEIMADLPVIPLIEFADYRLLNARLAGFSVNPIYGVDMWKLWVSRHGVTAMLPPRTKTVCSNPVGV